MIGFLGEFSMRSALFFLGDFGSAVVLAAFTLEIAYILIFYSRDGLEKVLKAFVGLSNIDFLTGETRPATGTLARCLIY